MSYDYYMFRKPRWYPRWIGRARALIGKSGIIATDEEIKRALEPLFPQLIWDKIDLKINVNVVPRRETVIVAGPAPEFQIDAAPNGDVTSFVMRRAERREIRIVERALGVVAMDMQGDGVFGMLFRG
jgi:hypothetical protein